MWLEHTHPPHHKQCEHDSISKRSVRFLRHEKDIQNSPRGISQTRLSSAAKLPERELSHLCPCYQLHSDPRQMQIHTEQAAGPRCCLHGKPATVRRFYPQLSARSHLREGVLPANVGSVLWKAGLLHFQCHSPLLNASANVSSKLPSKCCSTTCFIGANESHSKN